MPIVRTEDLPDVCYLLVTTEQADGYEKVIFKIDDDQGLYWLGRLDVLHFGDGLCMAEDVATARGWGPWLMDMAIEWATEKGGCLYPHHESVNHEAAPMFRKYFHERTDVGKAPMSAEDVRGMGVSHTERELQCFYTKGPAILGELRHAGKFKART